MRKILIVLASLMALTAEGKLVGHYTVNVEAQNAVGGRWTDVGAFALGWHCWASSSLSYREVYKNHRSEDKEVIKSQNGTFGYSLFSNQNVSMSFDGDLNQTSPRTTFTVTENCDKDAVRGYDRRGRPIVQHLNAYMSWDRTLDRSLPIFGNEKQKYDSQVLVTVTDPRNDGFPHAGGSRYATTH